MLDTKSPKLLLLTPVVGLLFLFFHVDTALADTCTASATGNWNTAGTWTCDTAPANHVPLSTDDVVITSAVAATVTIDTAAVANSVTVTNTAAAGTQNVILAVDANSLTLSSGGGITINGGSATSRNAQVTVSSGTMTIPGSVTFNNVRAQFISTGASTTNVGGNFGSGGTLTTTGTGTINFNGGAAQIIGTYTTYNNVEINNSSGGVSYTGTTTIGGTLLVNTGTLDTGIVTSIVTGATTVNGTLLISSVTGAKTFNDLTIANGGVMNFTAAEAILLGTVAGAGGNLTINGTGAITGTTGTWTFSKVGGGTISGTSTATQTVAAATFTTSYSNSLKFTVTGTTTATGPTITNTGTYTASGALSGVGGTFTQGVSGILNIGLTSAITTLDASASPNEVHYTGAAQTVHTATYHHLFIEGSGIKTVATPGITVNGNLNITAGTLADGGFQITGNATGTLSLAASTTLTLGAAAAATSFPTAFTAGHTTLNTTSTVNYNATAAQTISNVPTYGNLTLTGAAATKTAAGALTVVGNLTNATATGVLADGGFIITVNGNSTMTGTHTGTGKILFTGGSTAHSVTGTGYHNVELDDTNGALLSGTTTIGGTFLIMSGTWDTGTVTSIVNGATTVNSTLLVSSATGAKTFNDLTIATGGVMNFTAAEAILMGNATGLGGNLTINGTGTITGTSGVWTFSKVGGGTIGGTAPSITLPGAATFTTAYTLPAAFTVNGTVTVNTGLNEINTGSIVINGSLAGAGTFTQGVSTTLAARSLLITTLDATAAGNSVVLSNGAGGTIKGTTYVNLAIDKDTFTATAAGTVDVLGNLTVTSGIISFASSIFTVHGTTDIFGTLTDSSGGPAGGNNVFQGLVTVHTGAIWNGIIGEVCDFHFGNGLVMDGASFISSSGIYYFETNNQSISGSSSFTIDNLAVDAIQLTNSSTGVLTSKTTLSGTGEFIQGTNAVLHIEGTSTIATLTASASGNTVHYTGAAAQTVHTGTYQTLAVDGNTNGNVDILSDTTANTELVLGATIFSTSSNHMILGPGATVSRTSGFMNGYLQKNIPTGSPSLIFEIGSGTDYTPVDLDFNAVTVSGNLLVNTVATDHASIGTSAIIASQSANRFYSVANSGIVFGTLDGTFTFVPTDVDPGADTADFILAKYDLGTWSYPTMSAGTSTTVSATGMTSLSDFQIGETVVVPPTPSPTPGGGGGGGGSSGSFVSPQIDVAVGPSPTALVAGPGLVTYTYTVRTVPGRPPLTNISVSDTGCSQILFQSGDTDGNSRLDQGENWIFSCTRTIQSTTTSTITARGVAFGISASDTAVTTVTVSTIGFPDTGPVQPSTAPGRSPGARSSISLEFPNTGTTFSSTSSSFPGVSPSTSSLPSSRSARKPCWYLWLLIIVVILIIARIRHWFPFRSRTRVGR